MNGFACCRRRFERINLCGPYSTSPDGESLKFQSICMGCLPGKRKAPRENILHGLPLS